MTDAAEDPRIGQVIADRYRVEARLGAGGMGVVYLAEHVHMRKRFAVKVLHREMTHDEQVVARFERESVAASRIEHPNVVAAKDFGRLRDGAFYLVLDYVVGVSLRDLIKRGPIEPRRALQITRQIAAALTAAHAAGIIHRDLKPDNVMLVQSADGSELVKVLDFGIAKLTLEDAQGTANPLTQFGSVFGTPEYMAPEQALGNTVDHRADLYTLGAVLYEMLAGRLPFQSDEAVALISQHMVAEPPPLPSHLDSGVRGLVFALLAKAPEKRPQSARELQAQIDALLGRAAAPSSTDRASAASPTDTVIGFVPPSDLGVSRGAAPGLAHAATEVSAPRVAVGTTVEKPLEPLHLWQLFNRRVRVKGRLVPVWLLAAGILVVVTIVITIPAALVGSGGGSTPESSADGPSLSKKPLAMRASRGDAAAVAELEATPQDDLDLAELLALGAGRLRLGRTRAAVEAYKAAIDRNAEVIKRPDVVHDVRRAADDPAAARDALELAVTKFGTTGPDILFDVLEDAQPGSTVASQAGDLLESPGMRNRSSHALRIALDLSKAKKCAEFKDLLPRATSHGDRRSLPYLEKLNKKTGCGRRRRHDCFRCLRGDSAIEDAIARARSSSAPSIETPIAAPADPSAQSEEL